MWLISIVVVVVVVLAPLAHLAYKRNAENGKKESQMHIGCCQVMQSGMQNVLAHKKLSRPNKSF